MPAHVWSSKRSQGPKCDARPSNFLFGSEMEMNHGRVLFGLHLARREARCVAAAGCRAVVALPRWGSADLCWPPACSRLRVLMQHGRVHLEALCI